MLPGGSEGAKRQPKPINPLRPPPSRHKAKGPNPLSVKKKKLTRALDRGDSAGATSKGKEGTMSREDTDDDSVEGGENRAYSETVDV